MVNEEVLYREGPHYVGYYYDKNIGHVLTCTKVNWSPSEFKRYLGIWASILDYLRARGIKQVYGLCETEKDKKFNEIFGFSETGMKARMVNGDVREVMELYL